MGKFPAISITLKGATGENLEEAKVMLRRIIGREAMRFRFLLESDRIDDTERSQYEALIGTDKTGTFTMSDDLLKDSLLMLSQFLQKHYGQGTVMLIDEYDMPLDKAYWAGYYDSFIGNCNIQRYKREQEFTKQMSDKLLPEYDDKTTRFRRYKNLPRQPRHQINRLHLRNNPYQEVHPRSCGGCPRMSALLVDYSYIFCVVSLCPAS